MKKNLLIACLITLALITTGLIGYLFVLKNDDNRKNEEITIITDARFTTLQNDGGSYKSIKYKIDLVNKTSRKYEDKYVGLKGFEYQDKKVGGKTLTDEEVSKLSELFDSIVDNEMDPNADSEESYKYYTYKDSQREINIYSSDIINKLNELIEV